MEFIAFDKLSTHLITQPSGTAGHPGSPKVWRLDTPDINPVSVPLQPDYTPATALTVSNSGDLLAVADVRNRLSLYALADGLDKPASRVLSIPTGYFIKHIKFSRDDLVVFGGTDDARVLIWDLNSADGTPISAFDTGHKEQSPLSGDNRPSLDLLDISADHSLLLTGSTHWSMESAFADPAVRIWQLQKLVPKGAPLIIDQSGSEKNKALIEAFFDQSGKFLIAETLSGTVNAWDLSKVKFNTSGAGQQPSTQMKSTYFAESASHSEDRSLLAFSQGKTVSITRTKDLESSRPPEAQKLLGFDSSVDFVKWSNSARFLVAGAIGGTVRLWDLTHVDYVTPSLSLMPNPYADVRAIERTPSGHTAVTLRGNSLEFWDIVKPAEPKLRYATDIDVAAFGELIACQIVISPDDRWVSLQDKVKDRSRIMEIGADDPTRKEFTVATRTWRNTDEIVFSPDSRWLFIEEAHDIHVVYDLHSVTIERQVFSTTGFERIGRNFLLMGSGSVFEG